MKKAFALILALILFAGFTSAQTPDFTLSNGVIHFDIDNDGKNEDIELVLNKDSEKNDILLNISKNSVLKHQEAILSLGSLETDSIIDVYALSVNGCNKLYIEWHCDGSECLFSMWMVVSFTNDTFKYEMLLYDPGYTSGTTLYRGTSPQNPQTFVVYSADASVYSQNMYLKAITNRFASYGISFAFTAMPFNDWLFAPTAVSCASGACAVSVSHNDLRTVTQEDINKSEKLEEGKIILIGNAWLREDAATTAKAVTSINSGVKVEYSGRTKLDSRNVAWHYIKYKTYTGWVSSKYAPYPEVEKLLPGSSGASVYTTASVNLRTGPGTSYDKFAALEIGEKLEFLNEVSVDSRNVAWFKVSYKSKELWISGKYSEIK